MGAGNIRNQGQSGFWNHAKDFPGLARQYVRALKKAQFYYRLDRTRDDYIMTDVAVPGERWEIETPPEGAFMGGTEKFAEGWIFTRFIKSHCL